MTNDKVRRALRGISGVHVTAWKADGEADWALTGRIVRRIAEAGIHNIVSAGNTGEFYPMTTAEVERSHATAAEAAAGKALVTAGIGRSLREAVATGKLDNFLAQELARHGFDLEAYKAEYQANPGVATS